MEPFRIYLGIIKCISVLTFFSVSSAFMMAVFSFVLAGLLGALHLTNADEVILMEPFDPLKVRK